jgi:hypothetical protein
VAPWWRSAAGDALRAEGADVLTRLGVAQHVCPPAPLLGLDGVALDSVRAACEQVAEVRCGLGIAGIRRQREVPDGTLRRAASTCRSFDVASDDALAGYV